MGCRSRLVAPVGALCDIVEQMVALVRFEVWHGSSDSMVWYGWVDTTVVQVGSMVVVEIKEKRLATG
jgi:hypothetical protein